MNVLERFIEGEKSASSPIHCISEDMAENFERFPSGDVREDYPSVSYMGSEEVGGGIRENGRMVVAVYNCTV